jgi:hypothetical protein
MIKSRQLRWGRRGMCIGYCGKEATRKPKTRCRWVDNIKMDLGDIRLGDIDRISLAQDRDKSGALVNVVTNL